MEVNRRTVPPFERLSSISLLPLEQYTMPNGIKCNVVNSPKDDVVRLDIVIDSGYWRQEIPGQCIMTVSMLLQGTKKHTATEISETFDFYGARVGYQTTNQYSIVSLLTLKKYAKETFSLIYEILTEPTFPEKELDLLRTRSLNNYLMRMSQTKEPAFRLLHSSLYTGNHPCGKFCNEQTYNRLQTSDLKRFYNQYYSSDNASIFISGNTDDTIVKLAEELFGTTKWGSNFQAHQVTYIAPNCQEGKYLFEERPNSEQSSLRIGGITIPVNDSDFHMFNIMLTLFGGYFGSRLFQNIREDKGYTYGIGAFTIPNLYESVLQISCETAAEYVDLVTAEVRNEVYRLKEELVEEEELRMLKNYMIGEMCRNYEGALQMSVAYMNIFCQNLPLMHIKNQLDAINAATASDIRDCAQRYLNLDKWNTAIVGKNIKKT